MDAMKIGAIIQARMGSARLPSKTLRSVAGKPLLGYLLERLECCRTLDNIVVATSTHEEDSAIVEFCEQIGVQVSRGALDDVAGRILEVVDRCNLDGFVRICGDSPLLDPQVVDRAVRRFRLGDVDLVTNILSRSYPRGQSVEVVKSSAFRLACRTMTRPEHREHPTAWFYENQERVAVANFSAPRDWSAIRLVVDTPEDLKVITQIIDRLGIRNTIGAVGTKSCPFPEEDAPWIDAIF